MIGPLLIYSIMLIIIVKAYGVDALCKFVFLLSSLAKFLRFLSHRSLSKLIYVEQVERGDC